MASAPESIWNVESLRELMRETDRRYEERFVAQERAVEIAKQAADEAKGKITLAALASAAALLLAVAGFLK